MIKLKIEGFLQDKTPFLKKIENVPCFAKQRTGGTSNGVLGDGYKFIHKGRATLFFSLFGVHAHVQSISDGTTFTIQGENLVRSSWSSNLVSFSDESNFSFELTHFHSIEKYLNKLKGYQTKNWTITQDKNNYFLIEKA